jgi:hypothetical protein
MFINFGTILPLNAEEQVTLDSYDSIEPYLKVYIDKAIKLDEYGISDKASIIWEEGNKIVYLVQYLYIVRDIILKDYQSCSLETYEYYKEEFKLDCIRKTLSCMSIPFDVDGLYSSFGLNNNFGFDGISFMAIQEDDSPACENPLIFTVDAP